MFSEIVNIYSDPGTYELIIRYHPITGKIISVEEIEM